MRLLGEAQEHVDVPVFSGTFYAQTQPRIASMLSAAAGRGAEVRLCFGDPSSEAVETRDREEGIGGTLAAKNAYGEPASANPTLHLRRIDGGAVADHYIASFERVWLAAMPWSGSDA